MRRIMTALLLLVAAGLPTATAAPWPDGIAVLQLGDVDHALRERTIVISGIVRNAGRVPVRSLVIDAAGYSPIGDLAAFGADGIPWALLPGVAERFQIFLPLGSALASRYTVTVTGSQPAQTRPASVTRVIFPAFYRPLVLPRVHVKVELEPFALLFTAAVDDVPVTAVHVTVNVLVQEETNVAFRVLTVEVPVGRPLRLRLAPLIVQVVAVTVTDVVFAPSWTSP